MSHMYVALCFQVNADKIYTSKEFKRIKDNFQVGYNHTHISLE